MDKWIAVDVSDVSLVEEWTRRTIAILRDDSPYNPIFDPFLNDFNVEQLACRQFVNKISDFQIHLRFALNVTQNHQFTKTFLDPIVNDSFSKNDFLAIGIIASTKYFLILTFTWTLLHILKNSIMDLYLSKQWPLFSNLKLIQRC